MTTNAIKWKGAVHNQMYIGADMVPGMGGPTVTMESNDASGNTAPEEGMAGRGTTEQTGPDQTIGGASVVPSYKPLPKLIKAYRPPLPTSAVRNSIPGESSAAN